MRCLYRGCSGGCLVEEIIYHFVRHMIAREEVILGYTFTSRIVAHPLTKLACLMFIWLMSGV